MFLCVGGGTAVFSPLAVTFHSGETWFKPNCDRPSLHTHGKKEVVMMSGERICCQTLLRRVCDPSEVVCDHLPSAPVKHRGPTLCGVAQM